MIHRAKKIDSQKYNFRFNSIHILSLGPPPWFCPSERAFPVAILGQIFNRESLVQIKRILIAQEKVKMELTGHNIFRPKINRITATSVSFHQYALCLSNALGAVRNGFTGYLKQSHRNFNKMQIILVTRLCPLRTR